MNQGTISRDEALQNVEVRRNGNGSLSVWCEGKRLYGVANVNVDNEKVLLAIPLKHVRFGEAGPREVPARDDNVVVPFGPVSGAETAGGGSKV